MPSQATQKQPNRNYSDARKGVTERKSFVVCSAVAQKQSILVKIAVKRGRTMKSCCAIEYLMVLIFVSLLAWTSIEIFGQGISENVLEVSTQLTKVLKIG